MNKAVDLGLEHECNVDTSIDMTRSMLSSWNCPKDNGGCWSRSIGEPLHSQGTVVQSGGGRVCCCGKFAPEWDHQRVLCNSSG